jgi:vacuolar-type H+-ATPase subunit H
MREVIISILASEEEAKRLVAQAAARGRAMVAAAREKAREISEAAAEEAGLETGRAFAAALEEAAREKAALLAAAEAETEKAARVWEQGRRAAVALAVKAVLGTEPGENDNAQRS